MGCHGRNKSVRVLRKLVATNTTSGNCQCQFDVLSTQYATVVTGTKQAGSTIRAELKLARCKDVIVPAQGPRQTPNDDFL